jgi:hypothetical protein
MTTSDPQKDTRAVPRILSRPDDDVLDERFMSFDTVNTESTMPRSVLECVSVGVLMLGGAAVLYGQAGSSRLPLATYLMPSEAELTLAASAAPPNVSGKATLEMTGPESVTMSEVAERISRAVGRNVRYVDVAPREKHAALLAAGVPAEFADALDELFEVRRAGAESEVHLETHHALGVRPTAFAEFAERNAGTFRGEALAPAQLPATVPSPTA